MVQRRINLSPGSRPVRIRDLLRALAVVCIVVVIWGFSRPSDPLPAWIIVDTNSSAAGFTLLKLQSGSAQIAFTGSGKHWKRRVDFGTYRIEYHPVDGYHVPSSETKTVSDTDGGCFHSNDVTTTFEGTYHATAASDSITTTHREARHISTAHE